VRPPSLAATELFCLPLVLALAAARLDPHTGGAETAARDAARLAGAWGFSGAALEVLSEAAQPAREGCHEACLLELARRLAGAAGAPRGELAQAALERCARGLGLRPAELAELGDFAASARATAAA
jgi:predicted TIM-barrel fold metal-dependent hydrolase